MKDNEVLKYLERIGLDADVMNDPRDYELLKKIQYAHVTTVPYENLDILEKNPLALDEASLYKKVVTERRGGYCFELNGLLGHLLSSMGFKVHDYMARYLRGEEGIPMRRHRVIVVDLPDMRVLCDVGVGDRAARYPVIIEDSLEQKQFGEIYRFESDPFLGHVLCDFHKGEWIRQFAFTEEEQLDIDYAMPSYYLENHADSPFNKEYMIAMKTETGRKTVSGNACRVFDGDNVIERIFDDPYELAIYIGEEFGLKIQH